MRTNLLLLVMMLMASCSNPVKEPLLGVVKVTVIEQPIKADSIRVDIVVNSGKIIKAEVITISSAETTLVFNDIPADTGYRLVVKSFKNGRVKFSGSNIFAVQSSDETHLSIGLIPLSGFSSDCWGSALSCDTANGNYVLRWNRFEDSAYFNTAMLSYIIVMDSNNIPEELDNIALSRLNAIYQDFEYPEKVEVPIGRESRAYFRLFLYSEKHYYYMKDCQPVYFQLRSGI
ncbi:MAG: hypothetical protein JNL74_06155 [Fibrobacteres bacterium]|nr:hypothetical protein [Fibrobacterota bacterium]